MVKRGRKISLHGSITLGTMDLFQNNNLNILLFKIDLNPKQRNIATPDQVLPDIDQGTTEFYFCRRTL